MHHFFAVLFVFLAPTPQHPTVEVQLTGFYSENMAECEARIGPTMSVIAQRPDVQYVKGVCADVVDPLERAA